jgi:hypothetical protein
MHACTHNWSHCFSVHLRTLAGCMCGLYFFHSRKRLFISLQLHQQQQQQQQQRIYIYIKQIVMTTSPVTSNPNTDLISEIGKSLKLVDHLTKCPKLIICDGYKIREKNKFRSGEITPERVEAYAQYKLNLHALTKDKESVFSGAQVSVYKICVDFFSQCMGYVVLFTICVLCHYICACFFISSFSTLLLFYYFYIFSLSSN